jgi:cysteine-rich repeat protein
MRDLTSPAPRGLALLSAALFSAAGCGFLVPIIGAEECAAGFPRCDGQVFESCVDGFVIKDECGEGAVCDAGAGGCVALCGNGVVDAGEDCDDGDDLANDGCSAACRFEADIFVSCGGAAGAGQPGSLTNPLPTVQEGVDAAPDGGAVMILPQSPSGCLEQVIITRSVSLFGLADPSAAGERPTIDGGAGQAVRIFAAGIKVSIAQLVIRSSSGALAAVELREDSDLALVGVDIQNAAGDGILCEAAAARLLVDRSVIHDGADDGVVAAGACRALLANSLFSANDAAISVSGAADVLAVFSAFDANRANAGAAMVCAGGSAGRVDSSILNAGQGGDFVVLSCAVSFTDAFGAPGFSGLEGNIDADPRFTARDDDGDGDAELAEAFHLGGDSPCRDAARAAPLAPPFDAAGVFGVDVFSHDFLGAPRGAAPDMGLFEE